MVMCIHSGEFETCQFGCTLRKAEDLRLESDKLKERIKELEADYIDLKEIQATDYNHAVRNAERIKELEVGIKNVCDLINNKGKVSKWKILNWLTKVLKG